MERRVSSSSSRDKSSSTVLGKQRLSKINSRMKTRKPEVIASNKPLYYKRELHNFIDPDPDLYQDTSTTTESNSTLEKFSYTLKPNWKINDPNDERIFKNKNFNDWNNERPMTLPSISKRFDTRLSGLPRVSRQDILNRRTSFELPRPITKGRGGGGGLRRKSNSLLETRIMKDVFMDEGKDNKRLSEFTKASSSSSASYLKNTMNIRNSGKRSESILEKRLSGGARSAAAAGDFLTVSNKLSDSTRGGVIVPRASTLPKFINSTSRDSFKKIQSTRRDVNLRGSFTYEAPIYGRIRRRKLSLPAKQITNIEPVSIIDNFKDMKLENNSTKIVQKSALKADELRTISRKKIIQHVDEPRDDNKRKFSYAFGGGGGGGYRSRNMYSTMPSMKNSDSDNLKKNKQLNTGLTTTWHNVRKNNSMLSSKEVSRTHVSTTLPLYTKSSTKSSLRTGSSIPLKIASRTLEYNRQAAVESKILKTKSNKDKTNCAKKFNTGIQSRSMSDIHSIRSISPQQSSSIFGFCTGRRKVQSFKKINSVSTKPCDSLGLKNV